jgi:23S rRNA pseudouridine2457 synthase
MSDKTKKVSEKIKSSKNRNASGPKKTENKFVALKKSDKPKPRKSEPKKAEPVKEETVRGEFKKGDPRRSLIKPTNPRKTEKPTLKKVVAKSARRDGKSTTATKPVKKVWDPNFKPYFNKGVMMEYEDRPNKVEVFHHYYVVNKPYDMLCQFSKEKVDDYTLADLGFDFPVDAYPVGRLDKDSEGLLIVSNDKSLNSSLLDPENNHKRSYWVQVEGIPTPTALKGIRKGMEISVDGKPYTTIPAEVLLLPTPPDVPERKPPVRFRANIPTSWAIITLVEGKNRQVRRMWAKAGFPVLRLIRVSIENLELENIRSSKVIEMTQKDMYKVLKIKS